MVAGIPVAAAAIAVSNGSSSLFAVTPMMAAVAIAMFAGGVLLSKRVAKTMSENITAMDGEQGFLASLLTAISRAARFVRRPARLNDARRRRFAFRHPRSQRCWAPGSSRCSACRAAVAPAIRGYDRSMKRYGPAGLVLALALAACTAQQQQSSQQDAQQLASSAPDAAKNAYLTAAVATKLASVDVNSTTSVQVSASGGVVTLKGKARDAATRDAYDRAAKSIDGVASVSDLLTIDPKLRGLRDQTGDAGVTAAVMAAITAQAGVNVFHVTAETHDGTVTLRGSVPTRAVESTVLEAARGANGVRNVVSRLTISK
jgi:hyperosmotically inducible protein